MIVSTALLLSVVAALAYLGVAAVSLLANASPKVQRGSLWLAWGLHGAALFWSITGNGQMSTWQAQFGFAPALSMTAWLVLSVYVAEQSVFPRIRARWSYSVLAALAVFGAAIYPGRQHQLDGSGVLALHWALGLAAYGMFAAALVHAGLMRQAEGDMRRAVGHNQGMPLLGLERLMFRFIGIGFVMLSATLLAGVWLHTGPGFMRLDHKTVFSVLAWLVFAAVLLGRWLAGWRGAQATRMVVAGSVLLLLAYVGSRFVLEVVLKR